MHFKQLEQLTKDSFNLSTIVYAEETEQPVLDNLMHPGVHSTNSIKLAHYSQRTGCPIGVSRSLYVARNRTHQNADVRSPIHKRGGFTPSFADYS
jgi:hypothetical protein